MATDAHRHVPRPRAGLREGRQVTPLELFFDLVFVLAITQCTALMAHSPTWTGLVKGLLVLGILWWAWAGYAWLTSVVDPDDGLSRLVIFVAMAGLLVVALCVREAFGSEGLLFACAYAVVRIAHILLFVVASRDDAALRRSVLGLAVSTALCSGLLVVASFTDGLAQGLLWGAALVFDTAGPLLIGVAGWRLVPAHFAERHGLIVIIALGESIVAIGAAAGEHVGLGVATAAVLGVGVSGAMWWLYFDFTAAVAERRLTRATPGREQNAIARDSFTLLHFPMVAGIVLVALGLKTTLAHVGDPLRTVTAFALLGGAALYLLAHVAFRWRNIHRLSRQRLLAATVLLALLPAAVRIASLTTLAIVSALFAGLLVYETIRFAELRERLRHQLVEE